MSTTFLVAAGLAISNCVIGAAASDSQEISDTNDIKNAVNNTFGEEDLKQLRTSVNSSTASVSLADFIADFARKNIGKRVSRHGYSTTSCWDLAMAAVESANSHGFNVHPGYENKGGYVWSKTVVPHEEAKPGDIAEFTRWKEWRPKPWGAIEVKWTDVHHTAVVTGAYTNTLLTPCSIQMYDQNPKPVHRDLYHVCRLGGHISGQLTIYRLESNSHHHKLDEKAEPPMLEQAKVVVI